MLRLSLVAVALLSLPSPGRGQAAVLGQPAVAPAPVQHRTVWVVEPGPSAFQRLEAAVEAARSGDVILLQTDAITTFPHGLRIEGKGITIVGDGARRRVHGYLDPLLGRVALVTGVPAGETVVLRNLYLKSTESLLGFTSHTVTLEDNAGTIWIEDCDVGVPESDDCLNGGDWDGIVATDCASVVLVRTDVFSEKVGPCISGNGGPGLAMLRGVRSSIHAWESSFIGPDGADAPSVYLFKTGAEDGCQGVELEDSFLLAQSCTLVGGDGGDGRRYHPMFCLAGGNGEVALRLDAGSEARLVNCTLESGEGGAADPNDPTCGGGMSAPLVASLGVFEHLPGALRSYALSPSPATAGDTATLTMQGPPGEVVLTLRGTEPASTYLAQHLGSQLVLPPLEIVTEGTIPPSGELVLVVPLPSLPPLVPFAGLYQQGFFFGADGMAVLGSASAVVLLR